MIVRARVIRVLHRRKKPGRRVGRRRPAVPRSGGPALTGAREFRREGKFKWTSGETYEGEWKEGERTGKGASLKSRLQIEIGELLKAT